MPSCLITRIASPRPLILRRQLVERSHPLDATHAARYCPPAVRMHFKGPTGAMPSLPPTGVPHSWRGWQRSQPAPWTVSLRAQRGRAEIRQTSVTRHTLHKNVDSLLQPRPRRPIVSLRRGWRRCSPSRPAPPHPGSADHWCRRDPRCTLAYGSTWAEFPLRSIGQVTL